MGLISADQAREAGERFGKTAYSRPSSRQWYARNCRIISASQHYCTVTNTQLLSLIVTAKENQIDDEHHCVERYTVPVLQLFEGIGLADAFAGSANASAGLPEGCCASEIETSALLGIDWQRCTQLAHASSPTEIAGIGAIVQGAGVGGRERRLENEPLVYGFLTSLWS